MFDFEREKERKKKRKKKEKEEENKMKKKKKKKRKIKKRKKTTNHLLETFEEEKQNKNVAKNQTLFLFPAFLSFYLY